MSLNEKLGQYACEVLGIVLISYGSYFALHDKDYSTALAVTSLGLLGYGFAKLSAYSSDEKDINKRSIIQKENKRELTDKVIS